MGGLAKAAEAVGTALEEALAELAEKVYPTASNFPNQSDILS